ncbi:dihydromonapterin reductase [Aliiglaciecola sp. LCG003]|uniref:dihydromonapterin reductase n=1 Tax=Aliiglaciecola sp. LCG003 TaxID=3053655 RepID=UPI0025736601|nr:dihydromonapterin reductase [Aliiglaciecola sp. LCG003]WJG09815.1 dihydromonapterin reductase [Aliiglaciecola sp. LCG003]
MDNPIIITGGAQRIGLAVAEELLTLGHAVVITYRTERANLAELRDKGIRTIQADFSTTGGTAAFIQFIRQEYTTIRAIIHNASDWAAESPQLDSAELFSRMMQIHASTPYQINLALQDKLIQQGTTTDIIHMTDYVQDKGSKKHIAYAASKAALHNLTLSFAASLAPHVKVNSIAPALVLFNQNDSQEYKQQALKKSLLQTSPGAQEVVKTISYLLNSDFVTGRTMHLDGGRHLK